MTNVVWCLVGTVVVAAYLTLAIFLAMYGFSNPDRPAWYGVYADPDGGWPRDGMFEWNNVEQAEDNRVWDNQNVHKQFTIFFIWGFFQILLSCCVASCLFIKLVKDDAEV